MKVVAKGCSARLLSYLTKRVISTSTRRTLYLLDHFQDVSPFNLSLTVVL